MDTQTQNIRYRPELDGLRALAVLLVIGYHYFPRYMPGGYIGVDIFFVISGYLISSIVCSKNRQFSLLSFYSKRILRLAPSLLLLLLSSYIIGYLFLFSVEFSQLKNSIIATLSFVQNFYLYLEQGNYFQKDAILSPLLHIWSLSIEQQFYILFPLIILFCQKIQKNPLSIFGILVLLSLAANIYLALYNPAASYYLPHARFWELAAGSCLGIYASSTPPRNSPKILSHILLWISLVVFAASAFLLGEGKWFFGLWALPAVIGTLLWLKEDRMFFIHKLLCLKPVVFIGKISYPLYLSHWTALSLTRIILAGYVDRNTRLGLIAVSFLLSWLSYQFVEKRIRGHRNIKKKIIILCALSALLLALVAYPSQGASQFLSYLSPNAAAAYSLQKTRDYPPALACRVNSNDGASEEPTLCLLGAANPQKTVPKTNTKNYRVLITGDSHMEALYHVFRKLGDELPGFEGYFGILGLGNALGGSEPWYQSVKKSNPKMKISSTYAPYYPKIYAKAVELEVEEVIITGSWASYFKDSENSLEQVAQNTAILRQNGIHLTIIPDLPVQKSLNNFNDILRKIALGKYRAEQVETTSLAEYRNTNKEAMKIFTSLKKRYPDAVSLLDVEGIYCPPNKGCPAFDLVNMRSYYHDASHQSSSSGAIRLYPLLKKHFAARMDNAAERSP